MVTACSAVRLHLTGDAGQQGVAADDHRRSPFGLPLALAAEHEYVGRWTERRRFVTTSAPASLWQDMPSFYAEIIEKFGANLQPMVALVERIAASPWAQQLYPSTSMEALGLSKFASYEERVASRSVWFEYVENIEMFRVTFQEVGRRPASTVDVPSFDDDMWRRVSAWLELPP